MANFVLGNSLDFHDILGTQQEKEDISWKSDDKRHYKKDSRYLEDLYTLTYHEDSSIDQDENESKEIETFTNVKLSTGLTSLQVPKKTHTSKFSAGLTRSQSSGPLSLNLSKSSQYSSASPDLLPDQRLQFASSTLDTNLHKILARRMAGGQGVSYHSCKLLTKAYYKLLRDPASPGVVAPPLPSQPYTINSGPNTKLSWQSLVKTDTKQLSNIVAGYSALVKSLNEELVAELMTKDELVAEQDKMLERISELTDSML